MLRSDKSKPTDQFCIRMEGDSRTMFEAHEGRLSSTRGKYGVVYHAFRQVSPSQSLLSSCNLSLYDAKQEPILNVQTRYTLGVLNILKRWNQCPISATTKLQLYAREGPYVGQCSCLYRDQ